MNDFERAPREPARPSDSSLELTDWELLGTSKVGTTSWRARWQDRPVKIYRCSSRIRRGSSSG